MVFQLSVVIVIPIILAIVVAPPFDAPEEPPKDITATDEPISDSSDSDFLYFFLLAIWLVFLIRIFVQIRKGTFTLKRKY